MKKIFSKKNLIIFSSVLSLVVVAFVFAKPVYAGVGDTVAEIIGWIVLALVSFVGQLLALVIWVLIQIAQYSAFGTAAPVIYGWAIVRDVCNMFFILILLIIAFATILQVENYSFKKLLPKLIMMAVLINFSRLICNIFVDFTQVIMLTFVNGFKDVGGGNLTEMLGITDLLNVKADPDAEVSFWSILGTYILALVYAVVALVVVLTMVMVLAMRMIMLWVYIVLSPLAYLLSAFPQGQAYAGKWWSDFGKNLAVGPILAFFIWLSFASLGGTSSLPDGATDPINDISKNKGAAAPAGLGDNSTATSGPSVGISQAGSTDNMIKFIISIGMLIGGLQIAQEMGGAAGKMAGKGSAMLNKLGSGTAKWTGGKLKQAGTYAGGGLKVAAGSLDRLAGSKIASIGKKTGQDWSGLANKGMVATSIGAVTAAPGKIKEAISNRFSKDKALKEFVREEGAEKSFGGRSYDYDGNNFNEVNESGNQIKEVNWNGIPDDELKNYKVGFGDKRYEYDKAADSYFETDGAGKRVKEKYVDETGAEKERNVALQHNGQDLKSSEFRNYAENVEGASLSFGSDKYKFDKAIGDFKSVGASSLLGKNGKSVSEVEWDGIPDDELKNYKVGLDDKSYEYDKAADSYFETDAKGARKRDENGKDIALQHNGQDLKSNNFKDFIQNAAGASLSVGKDKYKFDKVAGDFKTSNKILSDQSGVGNIVKTAVLRDKSGKEVKAMSNAGKAWHDAYRSSFSSSAAIKNKAEDEKVSKEQAKIAESGMTAGDMLRELGNASTSVEKQKALALTLAIKQGFRTKADVDRGRAALGGNKLLSDKFNDTVDKNQAHLAYDYSSAAGRDKFKSRIDSGKIDTTKLDNIAYENPAVLSAMKEYHGKDYGRVIETAGKRGAKYEKSVAKGQLESRAFDENNNLVKKYNDDGSVKEIDGSAKSHAKITGDVFESFKNNDATKNADGTSKKDETLDVGSLVRYLSKDAKAADYSKINWDKFSAGFDKLADAEKKLVAASIKTNNLKSMIKTGENNDTAEGLTNLILKNGEPEQIKLIQSDKDIMNSIGKDVVKADKKSKQGDKIDVA